MSRDMNEIMLEAAAIEHMKSLQGTDDPQIARERAYYAICSLLEGLGYEKVVKEWDKVYREF